MSDAASTPTTDTPPPADDDAPLIAALQDDTPPPADDSDDVDIEVGDKKLRVPKEVKSFVDGVHAKTQTEREAIKAEKAAFERDRAAGIEEAKTRGAFYKEIATIEDTDKKIAAYKDMNAASWLQLKQQDPARYDEHWPYYQGLLLDRQNAFSAAQAKAQELDTKARQSATERAATAERELPQKIKGWSPEKRAELEKVATETGYSKAELDAVSHDPRMWQILNDAAQMRALRTKAAKVAATPKDDAAPPPEPPAKLPSRGNSGPLPLSDRQGMDSWSKEFLKQRKTYMASRTR